MTDFTFPDRQQRSVVETAMMRSAARKTRRAHALEAPMVVWTGATDLGKTTTAQWMTERINEAWEEQQDDPRSYRAFYYETGRIPSSVDNGDKRAVRSVFHQVLGTMDPGLYRRSPPQDLAELVVRGFRQEQVELLFVDEAGLLSVAAMRGMALITDVADGMDWPLTIVLVGMDDLPQKIQVKPQIESRVKQWVLFEEYDPDEAWPILAELFPQEFDGPDQGGADEEKVVRLICELTGGACGQIIQLAHRVVTQTDRLAIELDTEAVRTVWMKERKAEKTALERASGGWRADDEDDSDEKAA